MMSRICTSLSGILPLILGVLCSLPVGADVPLPPPDAAVESCSLSGRFCLGRAEGSESLRLYAVDASGQRTLRWEVRSTARHFVLSNDGAHWVEIHEGANLLLPGTPGTTIMLTFHRRAKTIARVELRQLVQKPEHLPRSVSHLVWAQTYGFDHEGRFTLRTAESVEFLFNARTGQPINRRLFR